MHAIESSNAPAAIGPYSHAQVSGGFVFTSGQIPLDPATGNVTGETVAEQTEQVIKNLTAVLQAAGSSLDKVVKTTCFLTTMDDFAAFNEVYAKHFSGKPARSCVAVRELPKKVLVEIEAVGEVGA